MNMADINQQMASSRIPPAWSPDQERNYSFRQYREDVELWAAATDVDPARHGPVVAMRLGGDAKRLAFALGTPELANGRPFIDGAGQQAVEPGLELLMRMLARNYAALAQEEELHSISALMGFRRRQAESTDECVGRFELVRHHAEQAGQVILPVSVQAWLLMSALGVSRDRWPLLLAPTLGALPSTQVQYNDMCQYIRRQGHLSDRNIDPVKQLGFYQGDGTGSEADASHPAPWAYHTAGSGSGGSDNGSYYDDVSSCASQIDEPLDFSDMIEMDDALIGESLYLSYAFAKRRWRTFQGKRKGGKSKGKGKHKPAKGKGNSFAGRRSFLAELESPSSDSGYEQEQEYSYKGSSSKPSGKRRGNPVGRDGKQMLCRNCNSPEHFAHQCPQTKTAGSGKGSNSFLADIGATEDNAYTATTNAYFGSHAPMQSCLHFADGTREQLHTVHEQDSYRKTSRGSSSILSLAPHPADYRAPRKQFNVYFGLMNFAWFSPENIYHTTVRLKQGDGEGLLVDTGAIDNLCGEHWAKRTAAAAKKSGKGSRTETLQQPVDVGGVGKHNQIAVDQIVVPVAFENGDTSVFRSPVITDSHLPALLGLETLQKHGVLIDLRHQRFIIPGPNGYQLMLSPGSKSLMMKKAISGHLLLPCTAWAQSKPNAEQILMMPE